jgi:hypothetical protein
MLLNQVGACLRQSAYVLAYMNTTLCLLTVVLLCVNMLHCLSVYQLLPYTMQYGKQLLLLDHLMLYLLQV